MAERDPEGIFDFPYRGVHMLNRTLEKSRGVILPLVGLAIFVLLGFAGLVIDLGGLFVAKTELQSALDSCALAAANELDGTADATTRATNAGLTAGNANKVKYQAASAGVVGGDVTFSDTLAGAYSTGFAPANARYAQCTHSSPAIAAYFIQFVGATSSNSVAALAIATRSHSQTNCPLPIGLLPKGGGGAPNYGWLVGEWVTMVYDPTSGTPSEMGWYNLDGTNSANNTKDEILNGYCGSKVGDSVGTPGAKVAVNDEWNGRFGIYKNNGDVTVWRPDRTGYVYTSTNWKNVVPQNAFSGTPAFGSHTTAANFKTKRLAFANYADTGTTVKAGDDITGLNMKPGGFKTLATPGTGGEHQQWGENKRVILTPVVSGGKIVDYACMLMLQPVSNSTASVQLEYLGNGGAIDSPCTQNGLAGGTVGPLVPTLVR